ncbi:MAG TPA: hypothetical protein VNQ77_16370 [Frankiaceae bacterium]|nr:hypothetical protein [Frankiaceae bacterium]
MNRVLVGVLACAALSLPATDAAASAPTALDVPCSQVSWPDLLNPEAPADSMIGTLSGGPIAQNGTLRCTLKVGSALHSDAVLNGGWATATGTTGSTFMPPQHFTYVWPASTQRYLCSQFSDGTTTWYLHGTTQTWTANAATPCVPV